MRRLGITVKRLGITLVCLFAFAPVLHAEDDIRFRSIDIFIDAGQVPVAAYQLELKVKSGDATIVGVEGGTHHAYRKPPYYDPAALMGGQIILAAFSTANDLPTGAQRFATVHVREAGPQVVYDLALQVVATPMGTSVKAKAWIGKQK